MNKKEYIKELEKRLKGLPTEDKKDAIRFYEDYIEEAGLSDSDYVEETLGTPEKVAGQILEDCIERQINVQSENASIKNSTKTIWLILLSIFAAPVALPLILAAGIVFFCVTVAMLVIDFSVLVCGVAFSLSGIFMIIGIFWAVGAGQKIVMLGLVFLLISVGVLTCIGFYKLGGCMIRLIVYMHKKLFRKYNGRKVE